jgi:O-acetyl-ADP-ribose deacetylase (regulator of RNase III)
MFKEIDGDMIKMFKNGEFDIISHGCNCFATMGAGIALTIGNEFPEAWFSDQTQQSAKGMERLGNFTKAEIAFDEYSRIGFVYNLYSQYNPGKDFRKQALIKSLRLMRKDLFESYGKGASELKIGFPLIGCGIAGGNWHEVKEIIKKEFKDFNDVTAVHFKQKVLGVNYWPKVKKIILKES